MNISFFIKTIFSSFLFKKLFYSFFLVLTKYLTKINFLKSEKLSNYEVQNDYF